MPNVYPVIVVKQFVDIYKNCTYHWRKMDLPIPPFVGLWLKFNDNDPEEVVSVTIGLSGIVILYIETDDWRNSGPDFDDDSSWQRQQAYQLEGWHTATDKDICDDFPAGVPEISTE